MTWTLPVCLLAALLAAAPEPEPTPSPEPVPIYTNADLERIRGAAGRTDVAPPPAARARRSPAPERRDRAAEETRWRREAQRIRERLLPLEDEIADLRDRIRSRRREPGVLPYSDLRIRAWEERIERLEARRRERWVRFQERARRARVPPGWLR